MNHGWLHDSQGNLRNGWLALGWVFTALLGFVILGISLGILGTGENRWIGQGGAVAVVLSATWVFIRVQRRSWRSAGFGLDRQWARDALTGIFLGAAIMGAGALALKAGNGVRWTPRSGGGMSSIALGFAFFTLVSLFEEAVFRGYPFQRLVDGLGPAGGLFAGAAAFTVAHWGNPGMTDPVQKGWATLNIALAAILLGLAYLRTRSLALPIGIHLGWNWAQGALLGFAVSGTTDLTGPWLAVIAPERPVWYTGGSFGLEASIFGTGAVLLAVLGMWQWKGRSRSQT